MREWSSDKVSVTVSLPAYNSSIGLLYSLNSVNVSVPLTHFYGFCKVTFADKVWVYISSTCTNDTSSTGDVECLFFVIVYLCFPVAGFNAIFDWYLSMLGCFIYLHIVKSMPCNLVCERCGFLIFNLTFTSHFTSCVFHLVALIQLFKYNVLAFHHMPSIFIKTFLKVISFKNHITTQIYFYLLCIFRSKVWSV